jgi:hypothetical protein
LKNHVLISTDPDDPQKDLWDVDDASTIITLADWFAHPFTSSCASLMGPWRYHTPAEQAMAQFKADGHEPVPASGLFNGAGVSLSESNILRPAYHFSEIQRRSGRSLVSCQRRCG